MSFPETSRQSESRSVLAILAFRKLWQAMAFSSLGDWLGLLAITAIVQQLAGGDYAKANFVIAGVFIVRLRPSAILGLFTGVITDQFDRRKLIIICDISRFSLYLSIPIVGNYFWLYTTPILGNYPGIMTGKVKPEYGRVVDICTRDLLRELATPGLLAVMAPIAVGLGVGKVT